MSRAPTPRVQLDGNSLVGPMGEFYAEMRGASEAFKARAVEAINCHDELVAALRDLIYALPSGDGKDWLPQFNAARAALAKVA